MISHEEEKIYDIRVSFLRSLFGEGVRSIDSFAVTCPACCSGESRKHKKKLSIKLNDGMHHCWICGLKGKTLRYTIRKYHPSKLSEYCRIFEEEDYTSKISQKEEIEEKVELPAGFLPIACNTPYDPDHIAVVRYLFERKLDRSDFYRWRLGTCLSGKFSRRVVMPSFDSEGYLNYFTARSIDSDGAKKYINSKVKRKDIIFNEINIRWNLPLTLVEGPFDLMNCNWNATAMLGSYLDESYLVFQMIVKNNTDVVLAMDSDAVEKRIKIAQKLKSYGINVKYINLDKFNDVGEMSKADFLSALTNAKEWTSVSSLNTKISRIRSSSIL
jgi:DNA primase